MMTMPRLFRPLPTGILAGLFLLLGTGCGFDSDPQQRSAIGGPVVEPEVRSQPLSPPSEAYCTIHVEGTGDVTIEDDYIANVVACENGNAPMEALKAQAVQARGYIYYKLASGETSVVDSQADQVYSCSYASAEERHYEAARATRGQVLLWDGEVVAPFYVAGAIPADQDSGPAEDACQGPGGEDPTDTEQWVTYNLGQSGCGIDMTPLGWAPDDCNSNPQNRGCASQNGQSCLADRGWDYRDMFPFYYGDDIELVRMGGECGGVWDGFSDRDLYCQEKQTDPGWSCYGDEERVLCDGVNATDSEDCPHGCLSGECEPPLDEAEQFCLEEADGDGDYCLDEATSIECVDGEFESSQTCSNGCEDGACLADDPDDENGENGDQNNDQNGDQNGDDNGDDDDDHQPGADEPYSLVTVSPGIEGGCAQATRSGTLPVSAIAALVLLAFLAVRRPRRKSHLVP